MWYGPSLQQFRFLQAVLEEGNLVRAANRLHTTHSTISRSLKALGSELGVDLFEKTPRGLQPNAVGRVYGLEIRKSLDQAKRAFDLAVYEANKGTLPFSVGHSPYIHSQLLPLLNGFTLPGVEAPSITLKSAPTTQIVRRVLSGDLRAGFGVLPIVDKDLWVKRVAEEPFSACIGERHSLAKANRLAARELRNETLFWISRDAHHHFYDHIVGYLRTLEFDAQRFQEVRTITQAMDFVAYGAGVALVPRSASRFQRAGVVFKPITDQLMRIETALFVRRDQMHGTMQEFVEIALSKILPLKLLPL